MSAAEPSDRRVDAKDLRGASHALIRRFGLLDVGRTPCGQLLAASHAHALMELLHRPRSRQGELAQALGLSKSAVSRMVVQLERRGWLERRNGIDGRVRHLTLTLRGRRLARGVDEASLKRFSAMLGGIPPATRARVVSTLECLCGAIPARAEDRLCRGA